MKTIIKDEDEEQLYYIVCDIAKICRKYFYERKYLPQDCWSIDGVIKKILLSSKKLKTKYSELKQNNND